MDNNNTLLIIGIVVAALVIIGAAVAWRLYTKQRLRSRFGPEYVRAVGETGGERQAESALSARAARVRKYHLHPLNREDQQRYAAAWRRVQAHFVDDPRAAAAEADELLGQVSAACGYPPSDIDQRLEDLSVDHGEAVQNYRIARDVTAKHALGAATTEDMRQAMIHYRTLFEDLIGGPAKTEASYA